MPLGESMAAREVIKAVLFDMDGVLVDVSRSYRRALRETVLHFTGRRITNLVVQRYKNRGGFNDDWALTHAIVSDCGMAVSLMRITEEFQRRYRGDHWNGFINDEPPLIANTTLEMLRQRGLILGIVTGRPNAEARWTLERLGWQAYFPLLIAREQYGRRCKPDPFPLLHALGILQAAGHHIRPEHAVYIGDTVDDMIAARAAGMWAIGIVPPYLDRVEQSALLSERGAHLVLDSLDRMPAVLQDWPAVAAASV